MDTRKNRFMPRTWVTAAVLAAFLAGCGSGDNGKIFGTPRGGPGTPAVAVGLDPVSCAGPGPVDMGAAASFGVLAGPAGGATLSVTNPTSVTGDVGAASYVPAIGTPSPSTVTGTRFTGVDPAYVAAKAAYNTASGCALARACDFNYPAGAINFAAASLQPLAPGKHCVTGAMSVGANMVLSNPGVYIFRSTGALDTAVGPISVSFGGAANAANTSIFWVPAGAATLQANVAFLGTIMPDTVLSAATVVGANSTLLPGRVFSNSDVTLSNNTIARPTP